MSLFRYIIIILSFSAINNSFSQEHKSFNEDKKLIESYQARISKKNDDIKLITDKIDLLKSNLKESESSKVIVNLEQTRAILLNELKEITTELSILQDKE